MSPGVSTFCSFTKNSICSKKFGCWLNFKAHYLFNSVMTNYSNHKLVDHCQQKWDCNECSKLNYKPKNLLDNVFIVVKLFSKQILILTGWNVCVGHWCDDRLSGLVWSKSKTFPEMRFCLFMVKRFLAKHTHINLWFQFITHFLQNLLLALRIARGSFLISQLFQHN